MTLYPLDAALARTPEMEGTLAQAMATVRPDVVLIQFPSMAQYVECCEHVATVMDVQDAFSVSGYREFVASRGIAKRLLTFASWFSWVRYESRYYRNFDEVLVLTEQDRYGLCAFSPSLAPIVSPAAVLSPDPGARRSRLENTIVFVGAFSHRPNVDAVRFFIDEVYPVIVTEVPDAEFLIAGRNPTRDLLERQSRGIRFVGFVDDMSSFLEHATVVVVPVRFGGGIKIKTLEAMAHGCAVVSTRIGVEEIGATNNIEVVVSDKADEFASAVVRLLRDPRLREDLGKNARKLIATKFGWEAKAQSMEAALNSAMRRRALRGVAGSVGTM
jgi:glycosyltransferase involved in cell wall biosynthesis